MRLKGERVRIIIKVAGWLLAIALLMLGIVFGINQTDEPLSPEAQALLELRKVPDLGDKNGFAAFAAISGPKPDGRVLSECRRDYFACLQSARTLLTQHAAFLAQYRALREKPVFVDTFVPDSPDYGIPAAYRDVFTGVDLVLLDTAWRFSFGDRQGALEELAGELAQQRKMAEGARNLLQKMISFSALDATTLFATELARRIPPRDKALQALQGTLREPSRAELDLSSVLDLERANVVEWMRTRKHVRLSDETYKMFKQFGDGRTRPWWDPVAPWFYRPHYSVNLYVAQTGTAYAITKVPSTQFLGALDEHWARASALEPKGWRRWLLSPAGNDHFHLEPPQPNYVGRAYGHAGFQALARLQIHLRAMGASTPEAVVAALEGPAGKEFRDPFTGKPFVFDVGTGTLGFQCEYRYLRSPTVELRDQEGFVRLPL